ncbi:MAG: bifunctional methylenetetrahydrofolate dehydrogenase/methenyltetrahydrofolate cyclohydrolase FolD [Clostridia bacterium]|nr:bifunctional methylenetetrahydrofolate dehydrogenase/methenyltetrahydrofolate cyclohydrolase FolD [Clostridia bacterium]MBP3582431.1 bifunctional methylenetetrahydrofolate dehydrogenase/methenyltetrahydrofolate cyclohydrolase FolD [Clostridia bacterium]
MAELISGKVVSAACREKIKREVDAFKTERGYAPGLAVILVGNNPASEVYVRNKHKACLEVGITSYQIELPEETTEEELLKKIDELNGDACVHGILVQLPLPKHISEERIIEAISPKKDVDAFHPVNVGKITVGNYQFLPCTPAGIIELLDFYNVDVSGKSCAVIGRSNIVGKPMMLLLTEKNGTVTLCHSRTKNLSQITKNADILVVAIGKPKFVTADMVKDGAVVIDVGINRLPDGKLSGDVDFEGVEKKASMITPVPGGVGPMTITMLLRNTLTAAKQK